MQLSNKEIELRKNTLPEVQRLSSYVDYVKLCNEFSLLPIENLSLREVSILLDKLIGWSMRFNFEESIFVHHILDKDFEGQIVLERLVSQDEAFQFILRINSELKHALALEKSKETYEGVFLTLAHLALCLGQGSSDTETSYRINPHLFNLFVLDRKRLYRPIIQQ
jgi:hypothetical protein